MEDFKSGIVYFAEEADSEILYQNRSEEFISMPSTKERLDSIEACLDSITRNQSIADSTKTEIKARSLTAWITPTISVVAIAVSLGGVFLKPHVDRSLQNEDTVLASKIDERIEARTKARFEKLDADLLALNTTVTELGTSVKDLKPLVNDLVQHELKGSLKLPETDFQQRLPVLAHALAVAEAERLSVDPQIISTISRRMINSSARPASYWAMAGQVISYRSHAYAQAVAQEQRAFPPCTDTMPEPMNVTAVLDTHSITVKRAEYKACELTLDSVAENEKINKILTDRFPLITFRNCVIVYRGGPIQLILKWDHRTFDLGIVGHDGRPEKIFPQTLSGNALEFENCLFRVRVDAVPTENGQRLTEELLAQSSPTVRIPG